MDCENVVPSDFSAGDSLVDTKNEKILNDGVKPTEEETSTQDEGAQMETEAESTTAAEAPKKDDDSPMETEEVGKNEGDSPMETEEVREKEKDDASQDTPKAEEETVIPVEEAVILKQDSTTEAVTVDEVPTEQSVDPKEEPTNEAVVLMEESSANAGSSTEEPTEEPVNLAEEPTNEAVASKKETTETLKLTEESGKELTEEAVVSMEEATEDAIVSTEKPTEKTVVSTEEPTKEPTEVESIPMEVPTTKEATSELVGEDSTKESPKEKTVTEVSAVVEKNPQSTKKEKEHRLTELIASGRLNLKMNEIEKATDALSDAAQLSAELYGENNFKTFDSLLYYGMAVLELAKEEAQLMKIKDDKMEVEKEEGAEEEKAEEGEDEKAEEDDRISKNGEDVESIKLAWELLENARCIADAHLETLGTSDEATIKKWTLQKAEVLVLLGEHGITDGKHEQAKKDILAALEIQLRFLPTSRITAQTSLLLGSACTLNNDFRDTILYQNKAKSIFTAKTKELEHDLSKADEEKKAGIESELKDLRSSIARVEGMIDEAEAAAAEAVRVKDELIKTELDNIATALGSPEEEKPQEVEVNDITNLVRRPLKRPPSEQTDASDAKKSKETEETAVTVSATEEVEMDQAGVAEKEMDVPPTETTQDN